MIKKPLWIPSQKRINDSNFLKYFNFLEKNYSLKFRNYDELYNWSINKPEQFWKSILEFGNFIYSGKINKVLKGNSIIDAEWFDGIKLNFAENLLRKSNHEIAIISARENFNTIKISYSDLQKLVGKCANGLRKLGVKKGDRVAGFVSNTPEAIIAMLATTSIGAIWSSCSPDFGLQGVLDRFEQIKPKVLFAVESYSYNGKIFDCKVKINKIRKNIPEVEKVITIPINNNPLEVFINNKFKTGTFNNFLKTENEKIKFNKYHFDHPVYIMYSSGTTGKPKCIVHGSGGTLLQHFKEHSLHTDLKENDIIFYFTTCGWMMWNWLVSALMSGSTVYLYDGSPAYPDISILWKEIEKEKINIFGTSPKYLTLCEKEKLIPKNEYNIKSLKTILSTGSPLSEENFKWVYKNIKKDIHLASISGGTDIISCFMLGNPLLPVNAGEIQSRGLGMKVDCWDENGNNQLNIKGELVCTSPFPSRPVFFWNDKNNKKYKSAYFDYFPGIWRHGDFIEINEKGGIVVYGRSDTTLNPGGVRIGTAEIYRVVESFPQILDSLVIGQNYDNDVRIILFVVLKNNLILNEELKLSIKKEIKLRTTPRHIPSKIIQVKDIPRTISGKKVELAVTRIINGINIDNKDALANPESLEYFRNLEELK